MKPIIEKLIENYNDIKHAHIYIIDGNIKCIKLVDNCERLKTVDNEEIITYVYNQLDYDLKEDNHLINLYVALYRKLNILKFKLYNLIC